jgi:secreted trypsin-like serine protease
VGLAACETEVAGGVPVRAEHYPFIVSIFDDPQTDIVSCGGTLIAPSWILTAAHCVCSSVEACPRWVVIGNDHPGLVPAGERLPVLDVHQYPGYSRRHFTNDIAVVEIAPQAAEAALVALAPPETDAMATLLGWGETRDQPASPVLLGGEVQPIFSVEECKTYFPLYPSPITQQELCSGSGVGACPGDSGGPLLQGETKVQIGVAFYHDPTYCGSPTLYIRVAMYRDWIDCVTTQPDAAACPAPYAPGGPAPRRPKTESSNEREMAYQY